MITASVVPEGWEFVMGYKWNAAIIRADKRGVGMFDYLGAWFGPWPERDVMDHVEFTNLLNTNGGTVLRDGYPVLVVRPDGDA